MFEILMTILVGGLVGWLASLIMKTRRQMGPLADVLVGVVGSFLGRYVFGVLGLHAHTSLGRLAIAVLGAVALIAILKGLRVYR